MILMQLYTQHQFQNFGRRLCLIEYTSQTILVPNFILELFN